MRKVTIYEVASQAGVSPATASMALSGKGRVAESTRKRVKEIAKSLNFVPSNTAQNLRTGNSRNIGFVLGINRNPYAAAEWGLFLSGILLELTQKSAAFGVSVTVLPHDNISLAQGLNLAAVVFSDTLSEDPALEAVHKLGIPIVTSERFYDNRVAIHIDMGYQSMTSFVLEKFKSQGATAPAIITEQTGQSFVDSALLTYRQWCSENNLNPREYVLEYDHRNLDEVISSISETSSDALYVFMDGAGPYVQEALAQRNLVIPIIASSMYGDDSLSDLGIPSVQYSPGQVVDLTLPLVLEMIELGQFQSKTVSIPWHFADATFEAE